MDLIVRVDESGLARGVSPIGSAIHTQVMKAETLHQALDIWRFDAAFGGARRDEEKSRAKERIFCIARPVTIRSAYQRRELWRLFNTRIKPGESMGCFPLSHSTELNVWEYHQGGERPDRAALLRQKSALVVERGGTLIIVDGERLPFCPTGRRRCAFARWAATGNRRDPLRRRHPRRDHRRNARLDSLLAR